MEDQRFDPFLGFRDYNMDYDSWRGMAAACESELSRRGGWKNADVPYDFTTFMGYRLRDEVDFVILSFRGEDAFAIAPAPDGGVRLHFGEDMDPDLRRAVCEAAGLDPDGEHPGMVILPGSLGLRSFCEDLILSETNCEAAERYMNGGVQELLCVKYGDLHVIDLPLELDFLRHDIVMALGNVRFTSGERINGEIERFYRRLSTCQPEPEKLIQPALLCCDGERVFTAQERFIAEECPDMKVRTQAVSDLRDAAEALRVRFEELAGIDSRRDGHFIFAEAVYPTCAFLDDAVVISRGCGMQDSSTAFLTAVEDGYRINYYNDPGVFERTFPTIDALMSHVEPLVLNPANVEQARKEYESYRQSQERSRSASVKPMDAPARDEGRGIKIK